MLTLFSIVGIAIPKMLNKMIRRDVQKDVQAGVNVKNNQSAMVQSNTIKPIRMEDFIKR